MQILLTTVKTWMPFRNNRVRQRILKFEYYRKITFG